MHVRKIEHRDGLGIAERERARGRQRALSSQLMTYRYRSMFNDGLNVPPKKTPTLGERVGENRRH
jgi:hypothetical protein